MIKKLSLLILLGIASMVHATEVPRYWIQYKMNNIHCIVRLNGTFLYSTMKGDGKNVVNTTFGHTMGEMLDQGENEVEILAYNLANMSPFGVSDEGLKNGYCDVTIKASIENPESGEEEEYEVVNLRATYDEEKELIFSKSRNYGEEDLNDDFYAENYESIFSPDRTQEMKRLLGKRPFQINHPQPFSWTKAEPFEDTLENRQKLWEVYNQIRTAIQEKDMKTLKLLFEPGASELAKYEGSRLNRHFKMQVELSMSDFIGLKRECWRKPSLEDYELKLYAGGKLFQLVKKDTLYASPIVVDKPRVRTLNPVFTYVNGNIGVAWF